jgi:hypothetical protein
MRARKTGFLEKGLGREILKIIAPELEAQIYRDSDADV